MHTYGGRAGIPAAPRPDPRAAAPARPSLGGCGGNENMRNVKYKITRILAIISD